MRQPSRVPKLADVAYGVCSSASVVRSVDWLPTRTVLWMFFFFQAEDGIRVLYVTGVQTCALPIFAPRARHGAGGDQGRAHPEDLVLDRRQLRVEPVARGMRRGVRGDDVHQLAFCVAHDLADLAADRLVGLAALVGRAHRWLLAVIRTARTRSPRSAGAWGW